MAATGAHTCQHDEVVIQEGDFGTDAILKPGMRVLIPCSCGDTPLDTMSVIQMDLDNALEQLKDYNPTRPLYHWSPRDRRKQIERYGLRPGSRPCASSDRWFSVCFGTSPSWAWALSGEQDRTPDGEWDLWLTRLDRLVEPIILPAWQNTQHDGIHEIRTEHRVYKRDLWWVGSRTK